VLKLRFSRTVAFHRNVALWRLPDDPDSGIPMIQPATPQNLSRPESTPSAEPGVYRIFREDR
jgi:hypothetical protein